MIRKLTKSYYFHVLMVHSAIQTQTLLPLAIKSILRYLHFSTNENNTKNENEEKDNDMHVSE